MSEKSVKIGFVGCGMMGQTVHLPNFLSNPACEVVALAEVREKVGRMVAERHRIRAFYASYEAMLEQERLDAVVMIMGCHDTPRHAARALRSGLPLYIEKPMALDAAQARSLADAAAASGAPLMVAYHKRYDPGVEKAKALIDGFRASGELGAVVSARVWSHHGEWIAGYPRRPIEDASDPKPKPPQPGSVGVPEWVAEELRPYYRGVAENLCHSMNLMRHLLGEPTKVNAVALRPHMLIYCPPMIALLDYGDFDAALESGAIDSDTWDEGARVNFEKGWIELRIAAPLMRAPSQVILRQKGKGAMQPAVEYGWAFEREAAHFIQIAANGGEPRSSGADSARDLAMLEAIFRCAQNKTSVALE